MSERAERFFAWVWRLNGLLLAALAVAGLLAVLAASVNFAIFAWRDRPAEQLTHVAGTDIAKNDLRLGGFRAIAGTQLLYAALASPSEYIGSRSSGGLGTARNLLFFDASTKRAHWLLPDNTRVIASYQFLLEPPSTRSWRSEGEGEQPDQKAIAILLELRDEGEVEGGTPPREIAVASPDGRRLATIVDASDGMLGCHQLEGDTVLVFYVADGVARVLDLDPTTRVVRSDGVLSADGGER